MTDKEVNKEAAIVPEEDSESSSIAFKSSRSNLSGKQWVLLLLLSVSCLSISQSISLFPPFYPKIAEEKGASPSVYGFILGSNCIVMFLVTPFIGRYIGTIGLKFAYTSGMFINGVCCCLTGFLDRMPPGLVFIMMSILIRMVHAIGNAGVVTSSAIILTTEFPNSIGKVYGLTRVMMNIGLFIGPALGGLLFQLHGYGLPFYVLGCLQCLVSMFSPFLQFDRVDKMMKERTSSGSVWNILNIKTIWIGLVGYAISTLTGGFLSVTLEPQVLRKYSLSPSVMGLLFGVKDGFIGLSAPFWGFLCDRNKTVKVFLIMCTLMSMTSLFLLDPPMSIYPTSLYLIVFGLMLNGIGVGGQQIVSISDSVRGVINAGYGDVQSMGCMAGLWPSISGLGRFVARSSSGILVDQFGHAKVTIIVFGLNAILVIATLIHLLWSWLSERNTGYESSVVSEDSESTRSEIHNSLLMSV